MFGRVPSRGSYSNSSEEWRLTVRANHELENSGYNQIDLTEGFSFLLYPLAGYLNFIHRMLLKIEIPAPFYARY